MTDLEAASRSMEGLSDPRLERRLLAEFQATKGELLAFLAPEEAVRLLRSSLAHFEGTAPHIVPSLELSLGRALLNQGRSDAAEKELLGGIEELERQRVPLGPLAEQVSYFDLGLPLFDEMVRLVVDRGDSERALDFVERSRARQLLDSLRHGGAGKGGLLEVGAIRNELPEGVALLYYCSLPDRLLIWGVSNSVSRFANRSLDVNRLKGMVASHRAAVEQLSTEDAKATGAALYDELVRPLRLTATAWTTLVIIPDETLQAVPFASLVDRETGRYLMEDHLLALAPSGSVFVHSSRAASDRRSLKRALVVGNPQLDQKAFAGLADLPGAEAEAIEVAGLYEPAELLVGKEATRQAFVERIGKSDVIHFAGHGASNSEPGSSGWLAFAPADSGLESGQFLVADMVLEGARPTRLVVLAGCRTAVGQVSAGEGALSLSRSFLAAGVPDVVSTLWDIDDQLSQRFFVAFHRALRTFGEPFAALRAVQVAQVRDFGPQGAHPSRWAPFICMGGLDRRRVAASRSAKL
jgi:CHAT domain-containing protein